MAAQVTFTWNGPQARARIQQGADRGMRKAVDIVRLEILRLILETPKTGHIYGSHQASAPGEAPASETGKLVSSFRTVVRGNQYGNTGVISTDDPKAQLLELGTARMAARPYMAPAVANTADDVLAAIGGEIRTSTGYSSGGK